MAADSAWLPVAGRGRQRYTALGRRWSADRYELMTMELAAAGGRIADPNASPETRLDGCAVRTHWGTGQGKPTELEITEIRQKCWTPAVSPRPEKDSGIVHSPGPYNCALHAVKQSRPPPTTRNKRSLR